MLWKTMLEVLRRHLNEHKSLLKNLHIGIHREFIGYNQGQIKSDLQNSIQDEFEKTTSNNSDNPQARLFLEPNEVEFGVGLVEDYIKNKPGLREIGEDIGG